ncbi:MAG: BMP family ABC transporter substrate-binding protein [Oscillospiraceae bacterium]|nr:BMP family ABC transporter substrate-binding protein [Oscillospiraceae bacterium]
MKKVLSIFLAILMIAGMAAMAGCGEKKDDVLKVGVIYISPEDDGGYSQAHAEGIAAAVAKYGDKIEIKPVANIDDADVTATNNAIDNLVNEGCKLIFTTSYGYMDPTVAAAAKYPNVKFCHCSGYKMNDTNMDAYFGQIETARYLSGIVAGLMTKNNKLGYVAAFPIPEVIRGINAYTLGALSVNPDVTVQVVWTNTWFGPNEEKAAAEALLANDVDVMAQHQDSPNAIEAAEAAGKYAIGYDLTYAGAPNAYLTAPLWDWGVYYSYKIGQVLDGQWKVENYWGGMKEGVAKLDNLSSLVSDEAKAAVEAAKPSVTEQGNAFVFAGPIYDQAGDLRVSEGTSMTYEEQMSMDWFVKGVIGELPS